jgi:glutaredoxin
MKFYIVHGITDCPACLRACALLMEKDKEYVFVEADFSKTYRKTIKQKFDWTTFPVIVMVYNDKEELVGGYDDLVCILNKEQE